MKCPECKAEIGECQTCPFCGHKNKKKNENICKECGKSGGIYFEGMCEECYNKKYGNKNEETENESIEVDRAKFLFVAKIITSILLVIAIVIYFTNKLYVVAIALTITLIIIYIIIQTFEIIIDLLQEINNKI